jgi:hypothetical protein
VKTVVTLVADQKLVLGGRIRAQTAQLAVRTAPQCFGLIQEVQYITVVHTIGVVAVAYDHTAGTRKAQQPGGIGHSERAPYTPSREGTYSLHYNQTGGTIPQSMQYMRLASSPNPPQVTHSSIALVSSSAVSGAMSVYTDCREKQSVGGVDEVNRKGEKPGVTHAQEIEHTRG